MAMTSDPLMGRSEAFQQGVQGGTDVASSGISLQRASNAFMAQVPTTVASSALNPYSQSGYGNGMAAGDASRAQMQGTTSMNNTSYNGASQAYGQGAALQFRFPAQQ